MRTLSILSVLSILLALLSSTARAGEVVINSGSAPPDPTNLIDHGTYASDIVWIRNVGCPPGWPSGSASDPCPSPGPPTEIELAAGGAVALLLVHDSSAATISGGTVSNIVRTHESASVTMNGGAALNTIHTLTSSRFTWSGGYIAGDLEAHGDSLITIIGRDFHVDGVPVSYGPLGAPSGRLTGTLASGAAVDNTFFQGGGDWSGTIQVVPAPSSVPTLAVGARLALIASLLAGTLSHIKDG